MSRCWSARPRTPFAPPRARRAMRTARCFSSIAVLPGTNCVTPASHCRCSPSGGCSSCACRAASRTRAPQLLAELAAQPPPDVVCLVITDKLDKKASDAPWVKAVEKHGAWVTDAGRWRAAALPALAARPRQTAEGRDRAGRGAADRRARRRAICWRRSRSSRSLSLLAGGEPISADLVLRSVGDSARYDVFQLAEAAAAGDAARALRVLLGLEKRGSGTDAGAVGVGAGVARTVAGAGTRPFALRGARQRLEPGGHALAARAGEAQDAAVGAPAAAGRPHRSGHQGTGSGRCVERAHRAHRRLRRRFASEPGFRQGSP